MGKMVNCAYCDAKVDKALATRYKDKNYHNNCVIFQKDREELLAYVCFLFGLKAPGPVIFSQIKNFLIKGYTHKGITNALKYFYEVKKGSTTKSNQAIGIVPYVYEEAETYFNSLAKKQSQIQEVVTEQLKQTPVIIQIKKQPKKEKFMYDIEDL